MARPFAPLLAWLVLGTLLAGCASPPAEPESDPTKRRSSAGGGDWGDDEETDDDGFNYTTLGSEDVTFPQGPSDTAPPDVSFAWLPNATALRVTTQFQHRVAGRDAPMAVGSNLLTIAGEDAPAVEVRVDGRLAMTHSAGSTNSLSIQIDPTGGNPDPITGREPVENTTREVRLSFTGWGFIGASVTVEAGQPREDETAEEDE